ncbi:GH36-type glycosyl hydrolase domain-containing protein [Massilia sp.]|uniref:GH36-type glycosyl hydrolase domain-containing protein n=1 Tax=Massilia sp. TaxID=1882437 RepID=UPI0028AE1DC4|nr:glucoamylase family protein [Massilia sp.]
MNEESHLLPGAQREGYQPVRPFGADEAPLRAEPFSAAQMAVHGRQLAARHELVRDGFPGRLLARLERNADAIRDACAALAHAAGGADPLAPAAASLLDHYPLIDEQVRFARHHLAPGDTRALPCLTNGNARAYQLALEAVSHGDGRLERDSLARFVAAYQEGAPLLLAELRAIPVMLRLALVENLRRLALRLAQARAQRALARDWAERMIATAGVRPGDLVLAMADMARTVQPMGSAFVAELARRLQGRGGALAQVLQWLDTRLADEDSGIGAEVRADDQGQAADRASLANSIASLRLLGVVDWGDFLETVSPVEQALRQDPCGSYGRMDAATRGHYRRAVERLARASRRGEADVAAEALALAGAAPEGDGQDARGRHVGYYLVGDGAPALRARLGMRAAPLAALRRAARRRPLLTYLGAVGALTLLFTAALLVHAWRGGAGAPLLVVFGILAAFGASELGQALARMMAARLATPRPLPRMDLSAGIPIAARTLVAVPALLDSEEKIAALCGALEAHYLANRDPNLRFCLLSDFADAAQETVFGDAELLEQARAAIAALNARHGAATGQGSPFLLLHRPRSWSAGEGAWIGRERKRGQFADLNALLRGGARERFCLVEGKLEGLEEVRYVIALDAGASLPRDGARRLVAAMIHPLNRPLLDAAGRRVVAGHALLQPRTTSALPPEDASRYARLGSGNGSGNGIHPAARGAPELDQDLFGACVYGGQGIYEVDACARVLDRLPQGQVLAHDLLAGCCLRAGLLDEVALAAPVPARYSDDVARRHRWIRGDWQLAGWLRARVPGTDGKREPNPLPPLARWHLFDGLRRSLVAPTLLAALLLCWALLPEPAFWSGAALAVFFLPAFLGMFVRLADQPHDMLWRQHLANWWRDTRFALGHAALDTAFLPHRAWYGMDAIVRSGWRMLVSRRKLLQWRSTRLVRSSTDMESNWRSMWFAPAFAVGTAVLLSFLHPFALFAAAPLLLLWFLSPVLAWWLSLPHPPRAPRLSAAQTRFLAALARRHWDYFETLAGAQDNWFAPDRLQEHPDTMLAHRTSPASIGIGLLSTLSARDFGFIPQSALLARLRASFDSMALLERHHGHFYAGYDTRTLAPLAPVRIDTAASGNLAGHLLTLAAGLEQLADLPIAGEQALAGMRATLRVVEDHAATASRVLHAALAHCAQVLDPDNCRKAGTLPGLADCLQSASAAAAALPALLPDDADPELRAWCARLDEDGRAAHADLLAQAPWMRAVHEYVLDASLTRIPTLRELAAFTAPAGDDEATRMLAALVEEGVAAARARLREIAALAGQARAFADMDFGLLYDRDTRLLAAGYDVTEDRLEDAACDQLASEARLASFIGIAHGQLPQEHWFALGRQLGVVGGEQVLLSRGGALRDYLMPSLVMPAWRGTLLDQSARAAVHVQADHARRHGVPWGVSDCACNTVDAALHYEYRAFGVPGLGLRRGLKRDLVIAPHAAMLGLLVAPEPACANLERMAGLGLVGRYGFYEAIDYTGARLPQGHGQRQAVVRAFLAQHQGMGLLALSHLLLDRPMQKRFEADPRLRAALPLLQERVPRSGAFDVADIEPAARPRAPLPMRAAPRPGRSQPEVQLLSNGRYHLVLDSEGGGDSRWHGLALTRRRGGATDGGGGLSCYLRDLDSGAVWTAAWQPALAEPEQYEALFPEGSAQLRRRDRGIELVTEIVVSPEDDVELRRMRIRNRSGQARAIELTSYVEVLPAPDDPDRAWPAQCAILADDGAILCTRPPRVQDEPPPWLLNLMTVHGGKPEAAAFETSRARFLGRADGNPLPAALRSRAPLAGADGAEPDPALAIRRVLALAPDDEVVVDLVLGVAETRAAALALAAKLRDRDAAGRVFALAWTHSQAFLASLDIGPADARLHGRLAGHVLYPRRALRADPALVARNRLGQSGLWPYAISGDHPLVLLHLRDAANLTLARQVVQAHAGWSLKGLAVDLVIWYEGEALGEQLTELVAALAPPSGRPGAVFVLAFDQMAAEDRMLMQAAARVVLTDERGSLAEQLHCAAAAPAPPQPPTMYPEEASENWTLRAPDPAPRQLVLDNGIGGFSEDGREYLVRTGPGRRAPAPWSNVLASPVFGSRVSESGQATSWSENGRDFRITASDDDPLREAGGEAFYLRDEHSGAFWSPTALPAPSGGEYLTRHGFGYSVFEHAAHGIHSELTSFVALDAPLKYTVLRVRNDSSAPRRLSATGYVAWVLGRAHEEAMHVVTGRDPASGALVARNAWHADFAGRTGFFHVDAEPAAFTCDRMEFIGRGRDLANPAALARATLSSAGGAAMGAALDPCAALQMAFELQPGEQKELVFVLGVGDDDQYGAAGLVRRCGGAVAAGAALEKVRAWWNETLGAVRVATPDPALDALANGWLLYQAIAGRMWAHAGGATVVGEVLQDALALVHARPQLLRAQLLLCAARQYVEGDVQHCWHAPSGRGLRTGGTIEALWLPFAVCRYVAATGDDAVLDESLPYLEGRAPEPGAGAHEDQPAESNLRGDLYEHCVRALRHAMRFGAHGLPVHAGEGEGGYESTWLGWFMAEVLQRFAGLAERRADYGFATTCRATAQVLAAQAEEHAWDGERYRRTPGEDGSPPGPADRDAQSWSVLSGVADPQRAARALDALAADEGERLDTRSAAWAAMAFAQLGQGERAWALLDAINPARRTATPEACARYAMAPYAMAEEVPPAHPYVGCGRGSWYTSPAGWTYRLIVESLLGIGRQGERLVLSPQLPRGWPGFRLDYRYRNSLYEIEVRFAEADALLVDGREEQGNQVALADDGRTHRVELLVARWHGTAIAAASEEPQSKSIT